MTDKKPRWWWSRARKRAWEEEKARKHREAADAAYERLRQWRPSQSAHAGRPVHASASERRRDDDTSFLTSYTALSTWSSDSGGSSSCSFLDGGSSGACD